MAKDIKIVWNTDLNQGDFDFLNDDLIRDGGLQTAVIISLFTDARASDDDQLDDKDDRRGWFGDLVSKVEGDRWGSKLWLLNRSKTTQENIVLTKVYIKEALQWMLDDGVAAKILIEVERAGSPENNGLEWKVEILKIDGNTEAFQFDDVWIQQFS